MEQLPQIRRKGSPSISRTFDLRDDAEAWAREVERELRKGNVAVLRDDAMRVTLGAVCDDYVKKVIPHKRDHSAAGNVERCREKFGKFFVGAARAIDIAAWRDELVADGLGAQSVIHRLNTLSSLFLHAEREMSIPLPAGNPVRDVRKPAKPRARDRRLRAGEYDHLLAAASRARAPGVRQIIVLAVETSMRLGELLALRWEHIDLRRQTAHLPVTKNGESRTIALSTAAVAALKVLQSDAATPSSKDDHDDAAAASPNDVKPLAGKVFRWLPNTVSGSFEKVWQRTLARARATYEADCAEADRAPDDAFLADLRFHDLRHEATSRLFGKGLGIMEVASMTGHKSLSMLRRYTHIEAERLAAKLG